MHLAHAGLGYTHDSHGWSLAEAFLAIICASAPALKPFFSRYLGSTSSAGQSVGRVTKSSFTKSSYKWPGSRSGYRSSSPQGSVVRAVGRWVSRGDNSAYHNQHQDRHHRDVEEQDLAPPKSRGSVWDGTGEAKRGVTAVAMSSLPSHVPDQAVLREVRIEWQSAGSDSEPSLGLRAGERTY